MRRVVVLVLAAVVVGGALSASPAQAGKKKAKPVATKLYLHGQAPFGEVDGAQWAADGFAAQSPMTLTAEEPAAGPPKSMNYFNPALNDQCTGLPLGFPTFTGELSGTIVGDAKLTAHFASVPAKVTARLWADIGAFVGCNEGYIEPASEVVVDVPGGHSEVEIVFKGLKLPAQASIMLEILVPSGTDSGGSVGRLLYDSTDMASVLEFKCIPASGTSCTP